MEAIALWRCFWF